MGFKQLRFHGHECIIFQILDQDELEFPFYEARVFDDCDTGACGPDLGRGSSSDFRLGWTVGGGVEYCLSSHWSTKIEYLYFDLENDKFDFHDLQGRSLPFDTETDGHIFRAGLNYRF